ncbi:MAG: bifunctional folylpolyglutamate synthase/dihydrofolate synthase [Selenomonadales bacterium]|nr:bifunctional folylpolyglutamate synthase/dihydrofolate synthase [Selenomonadales bacterium]
MNTYQEAIDYLESLNRFGIRLGLVRIEELLRRMGEPQNEYPTIHVTGTNGKGSATAMLSSILTASGKKTGMYTSPHLSSYTERVRIGGEPIDEAKFAEAIFAVKEVAEQMETDGAEYPTQFEVLTAAAFWLFAKENVDYAVIEVGLGGLLDSTNVIVPELSIITSIAVDHAEKCGDSLNGIAEHKAGIIKEGVPVFVCADGEPLAIVERTAETKGADVYLGGRDFSATSCGIDDGMRTLLYSQGGMQETYRLRLLGSYQVDNASIAIAAAKHLGVEHEAIACGLETVVWPCRLEILSQSPTILLDGAHNLAGVTALRASLDELFPNRKILFLLGILQDKDVKGMAEVLVRECDEAIITWPLSERAASPETVAQYVNASYVETVECIEDGIERIGMRADADSIICIAGSFYLVGRAREVLVDRQTNEKQV